MIKNDALLLTMGEIGLNPITKLLNQFTKR